MWLRENIDILMIWQALQSQQIWITVEEQNRCSKNVSWDLWRYAKYGNIWHKHVLMREPISCDITSYQGWDIRRSSLICKKHRAIFTRHASGTGMSDTSLELHKKKPDDSRLHLTFPIQSWDNSTRTQCN